MTPSYECGGVQLFLGDAAEVLSRIDVTIDLVATDPPYGVGYFSHGRRLATPAFGVIHGDLGEVDVPRILGLATGLLREKRHVYVFGPRDLVAGVERLTSVTDLVWDKGMMGGGNLELPWGPAHEPITFAVCVASRVNRARGDGRLAARMRSGSVLRVLRPNSGSANRHPNEKPVGLMRQIVESSSRHGDLVLDPFMGSGSTVVAAILEGRRAIGIEIDPRYFEVAKRRVEALAPLMRELESA